MNKKIFACFVSVILLSCLLPGPAPARGGSALYLGSRIDEMSFTSCDGQTVALYDLLAEYDLVLLNLWATWCGPCEMEFPALEAAYEANRDHVAVLALSIEKTDTDEKLTAYAESHHLTFFVGRDPYGLLNALGRSSIPTSVVIDRFGVICYIESGAITDPEQFTLLFDAFSGDAYTHSQPLTEAPRKRPTQERADPADLAEALGTPAVSNPADESVWPMVILETEGRRVVSASNTGENQESHAEVICSMTAAKGDVLAITFSIKTYPGLDILEIAVDGETVKRFTGNMPWTTFAIPVTKDGTCEMTIAYRRYSGSPMADHVYVDEIAVLSGGAAEKALKANPVYPVSDETALFPVSSEAKRIAADHPEAIEAFFGSCSLWIIPDTDAVFRAEAAQSLDPDAAFLYSLSGDIIPLRDALKEGQYTVTVPMEALTLTGRPYGGIFLYADPLSNPLNGILFFYDEENTDAFFGKILTDAFGRPVSWAYTGGETNENGSGISD